MNRRHVLRGFAWYSVASLWPSLAAAQKGGKGGGGGGKGGGGKGGKSKDEKDKNLTEIAGTIKAISPQGVLVESDDNKKYLVAVNADAQIELTGEADSSLLALGSFVEFEAELDRLGHATSDVAALTFVEPNVVNPPGLFPTSLSNGDKENSDESTKSTFLVRGRVMPPRGGHLVVQVLGKNVSAKVSSDVTLAVRFNSLTHASSGDTISAKVEQVPQPNTGVIRVICHKLTISVAAPIQSAKAKRDPKSAEKSTADES